MQLYGRELNFPRPVALVLWLCLRQQESATKQHGQNTIDCRVHSNGTARLTDGRVVHEGGRDSAVCSKSTHMMFPRPCYHSGSQRIFGVLIVVACGMRERESQLWREACDSPTDLGSPPG